MHCAVCNVHWNITIGTTTTISQEKASLVKFPITESFSVISPDQLCNNWQGRLKPWEYTEVLLLRWNQQQFCSSSGSKLHLSMKTRISLLHTGISKTTRIGCRCWQHEPVWGGRRERFGSLIWAPGQFCQPVCFYWSQFHWGLLNGVVKTGNDCTLKDYL